MTLFLKTDVHVAVIGPAAVLLDLDADSYLCLPQGGAAFRRLPCGATEIAEGPEAAALADAGLVTGVGPSRLKPLPDKPGRRFRALASASRCRSSRGSITGLVQQPDQIMAHVAIMIQP